MNLIQRVRPVCVSPPYQLPLQFIQVLHNNPLWNKEDRDTYRKAHRLLIQLSKACDNLPSSLFISGVLRLDEEAMYGGGFADIFRAIYNGNEVALKRLRVYQAGRDRQRIHRVCCEFLPRHCRVLIKQTTKFADVLSGSTHLETTRASQRLTFPRDRSGDLSGLHVYGISLDATWHDYGTSRR